MIKAETTALILVGYQNDYFQTNGRLNPFIQETLRINSVVDNTVALIEALPTSVPVFVCPTHFTHDYAELTDPEGILKIIRDLQVFQADDPGSELIDELKAFGDRITVVHGKRGFNAFASTALHTLLRQQCIAHVLVAGVMTAVCVDSTGRRAHELGYQVSIVSDCTAANSLFEQNFYCDSIFPSYARVLDYQDLLRWMFVTG